MMVIIILNGVGLFILYINDLDSRIINRLVKCADDSKVFGAVSNINEVNNLRQNLSTLCKWSEAFQCC